MFTIVYVPVDKGVRHVYENVSIVLGCSQGSVKIYTVALFDRLVLALTLLYTNDCSTVVNVRVVILPAGILTPTVYCINIYVFAVYTRNIPIPGLGTITGYTSLALNINGSIIELPVYTLLSDI